MSARSGSLPTGKWLRGPLVDTGLIAFGWVPFLVFVVVVLGIGGEWTPARRGVDPRLERAMFVALAATYVHRHYTFLLVYGDAEAFRRRAVAYVIAPVLVFGGLALVLAIQGEVIWSIPGVGKMRPWFAILIVVGAWNMWHTLMQRHGLHRIFAGRAGGGLQERSHGRRDLALLWSMAAATAVVVPVFRAETFVGVGNARRMIHTLRPLTHGPLGIALVVVVVLVLAEVFRRWLAAERNADLSARERIPRLTLWFSTASLLLVFVVWGPIAGYLCFGMAHAIEYVVFVHHFGARKYAGDARRGLAGALFGRPMIGAIVLVVGLLALFWVLRDVRRTETYIWYYTATSLLHFLYDGWIWKVRKPAVARPLGIGA